MTTNPQDTARQKELVVNALYSHFFGDPELNLYAVLDGASIPDLLERLEEEKPESVCLYRGELSEDLASAAPYLVHIIPDTPFTEWLLLEGWGNHWGIFVLTKGDLKETRKHFRTFLLVKDPEGRQLYFRFYDPRVLRTFIPMATPEQVAQITGLLEKILFEAEDRQNLQSISRHTNWKLESSVLMGGTFQ
jgi:Domain of unknown function (DUF4123)